MNILANLNPSQSRLVKRIRRRLINYDQNYICFFSGATGSGKTESALSLACAIDPDFTEENVVWTIDEFLSLINSGKLKKGSCVLFDEYAISVGARDWYSVINKVCIEILQTMRVYNLAVIFTAPSLELADKKTKMLLHGYYQTKAILRRQGLCKVAVYDVIHNPKEGKTYLKAPIVRIGAGRKRIPIMLVSLAPKSLRDNVKARGDGYKRKVSESAEEKVKLARIKEEEKKAVNKGSPQEIAETIKKDMLSYMKEYGGRVIVNSNKIFADFRISSEKCNKVKAILEESEEFNYHRINADSLNKIREIYRSSNLNKPLNS